MKGAVLWLINLGVLKEKREGNTHFQMSRVIMQTMTQRMKEGGREGEKKRGGERNTEEKRELTKRYKEKRGVKANLKALGK